MSLVEVLVGAVVLAGAAVVFFKNKADESGKAAILGETRGQDKELKAAEEKISKAIEDVINSDDSQLTPEERADRWNK